MILSSKLAKGHDGYRWRRLRRASVDLAFTVCSSARDRARFISNRYGFKLYFEKLKIVDVLLAIPHRLVRVTEFQYWPGQRSV